MNERQELLRELPKIDVLLAKEEVARNVRPLGHDRVAAFCRLAVSRAKERALQSSKPPTVADIVSDILGSCKRARAERLGRVINGTGVLLHTNLGRAPLGRALFDELGKMVGGYCNLEINVLERKRGGRGEGVVGLLKQVTGAEDATVVNNNAAALYLLLKTFADGREVVVSRGELVQIGGGFRIPDILRSAGATLREVGTTNITSVQDYRDALTDKTAVVLKVHQANFRMEGFVKSPSIRELRQQSLGDALVVSDLGSGNLQRKIGDTLVPEPTPREMLAEGADLVCFSADKMLGGVQGGVIAGSAALVSRIKQHPVMRVVRPSKVIYAALQVVLEEHLAGASAEGVRLWSLAAVDRASLRRRAERFVESFDLSPDKFSVVDCESTFGGGSTPGFSLQSAGIRVAPENRGDEIAAFFQTLEPPVIGTVGEGGFVIDFRTVLEEDEPPLAEACRAWGNRGGQAADGQGDDGQDRGQDRGRS